MKHLLPLLALGLAVSALAAPPAVTLRTVVASGLSAPVAIANAGDGSGRLFIAEQDGRVRIVTKEGALLATPFLDISPLDGGERGLLGLAFHPQYAANRKFYVFYTPNAASAANYTLRVSEFLASAANPNVADAGSERRIIAIPHPGAGNHNGGQLAFGPEGYLYISTGDGGGGGDPSDNAQNLNSLLGKLLRIDVNGDDFPTDANFNYAIPPTNPFVDKAGADEIWAYGLRNPWRVGFDRMTGDLFIADVGQGAIEEVSLEPAGNPGGRNYGWDDMEGSLCFEPMSGCLTANRVLPILEHTSGSGWHAIIGGYVYRGRRSAALRGFYIYGDHFVTNLHAASANGDGTWSTFPLVAGPARITAFGEDEAGELYVVGLLNGDLHAIEGPDDPLPPRKRGDLNGDDRADVLWRNVATGENYAYLMNGTAIQGEGYLRTVAELTWTIVGVGDFDGNGTADILWRNINTGENYVYLMNGTMIVGEGYLRTVADQNWTVAGVGDFNGDGKDDVLWRNISSGENYLYPMNGLAILATEGYVRTVANQDWEVAGVGDLDGDGKSDILWRHRVSGENYLYPMLGRTIKPTEGYLRTVADLDWRVAGVGDFDGDGKDDIVWRNSSTGENYMYLMTGTAIAGEGYLRTAADQSWQIVQIGDFDLDGKADVLWRNSNTGENYLYPMDRIAIKATEGYLRTAADQDWQVVGHGAQVDISSESFPVGKD
jgi:glucose/arabinose dehydrogenase